MRFFAFFLSALSLFASTAWGAAHWVDVTAATTTGADGTASYMRWSPLVADATGNVTKLRIRIRDFGSPTEIRLALYDQLGAKQAEGTATVTATGYKEIVVPPVKVIQGTSYFLAAQAASATLSKFDCGASSGGLEGPNPYSAGFPLSLPGSWGAPLLTGGMHIEGGPVADFVGTPTVGTAPLTVQFTDRSSGSITGWLWNFGDGSQSTDQNPQHQYALPGAYSVSLTVTGPEGSDTAFKQDNVRVSEEIPQGNNEYQIKIDSAARQKYGLYYPATYRFRIQAGSSGLSAQYRYQESTWNTLPVKTAEDIFNGIDAVRFDYTAGYAYVSVRFSRASDNIYLRILDSSSQPISIVFDGIPKYYDDRKAAVTITLDDWDGYADAGFRLAVDQLNALGLYYSVGLRLLDPPWSSYQEKVNQSGDKLEIASHSIYHSCDATSYQLHGFTTEVIESRNVIRDNLTFPAHPYIPLYIDPCGYWDNTLYSTVAAGDYLIERGVDEGADFVAWDSNGGRYRRTGVSYDWGANDTQSQLATANSIFNSTLAAGGLYHLMDHPWQAGHFATGSFQMQHLNYIKGRPYIWYAPFGATYLYHYLQEMRGNLTVQALSGAPIPPLVNFSATPLTGTVPLVVTFTDSSTGAITGWSWDFGDSTTSTTQNPVHVYNNAGTYTVKLTATGSAGTTSIAKADYITVQPAPVGHWVDVTTAKTGGVDGTANYMSWGAVIADTSGNVTKLRVGIRAFGSATAVRMGLYSQSGTKLTEGVATVTAAGYAELAVPAAPVVQGTKYFIAAQAASDSLHKFDTGARTGGFEGPNKYPSGLPARLPLGAWANALLTSGMYIE